MAWTLAEHGAETQTKLAESLFHEYFELPHRPLSDHAVLLAAADRVGLDRAAVKEFLESGELGWETRQEIDRARRLGIRGVPHLSWMGRGTR